MALQMKSHTVGWAVALLIVSSVTLVKTTIAREGSETRTAALLQSQTVGSDRASGSSTRRTGKHGTKRLREGTVITDQAGSFREDGDGATFIADSGMEFGALPNLNLERVVRLLKSAEEPDSIRWSVSGQVTEFSGRNFLLLSRAVYKSTAPPPVPERIFVEN